MSKTDDTKTINDKPTEDFFCPEIEDSDDSTQISALLKWFENSIKKQMPDATQTEFRRIVGTMSADEFVDKYFPSGICTADFWILANTLEDDDFYPLVSSMFEDANLSKSPVDPETVYGNVSYERLRFVLINHYYDLDAGAPFFARAHYDGAYSNEFPIDYKRAFEMLLRYMEISGGTTNEFEKLFSVCGEEDSAKLLANLIAGQAVGIFSYLAQKSTSEIEARVRAKALDLLEEYGLLKIKENFEHGFVIDTHGNLFKYFGNDNSIIVPDGTTFICTGAFYNNAHTITLPKSVVGIGDFALDAFQNIHLSADIKQIGYSGLGIGPALIEGAPSVTVYAPSDACSVAEYCKEHDIVFVPQ